jgi:hypothetical protein
MKKQLSSNWSLMKVRKVVYYNFEFKWNKSDLQREQSLK